MFCKDNKQIYRLSRGALVGLRVGCLGTGALLPTSLTPNTAGLPPMQIPRHPFVHCSLICSLAHLLCNRIQALLECCVAETRREYDTIPALRDLAVLQADL